MNEKQASEAVGLLDDLRKLLILGLFDRGFSQENVAKALGKSQPTISRMFPKGSIPGAISNRAGSRRPNLHNVDVA